jgi:hypothetical protein
LKYEVDGGVEFRVGGDIPCLYLSRAGETLLLNPEWLQHLERCKWKLERGTITQEEYDFQTGKTLYLYFVHELDAEGLEEYSDDRVLSMLRYARPGDAVWEFSSLGGLSGCRGLALVRYDRVVDMVILGQS